MLADLNMLKLIADIPPITLSGVRDCPCAVCACIYVVTTSSISHDKLQ